MFLTNIAGKFLIVTAHTHPTILAISGSLRANSSNNAVLVLAEHYLKGKAEMLIYNGLGNLPHFDDSTVVDPTVTELRELIRNADGVLICSPEYAFGVPGSLKNAIDWTVSSGEFVGKPVALITAATGGDKAHTALIHTFTALSANMPEQCRLLLPFIRSRMNEHGEIVNIETKEHIHQTLESLLAVVASDAVQH